MWLQPELLRIRFTSQFQEHVLHIFEFDNLIASQQILIRVSIRLSPLQAIGTPIWPLGKSKSVVLAMP